MFGIGSYTYQFLTRDTFGFAMKATWGQINGESVEIFKDPKTDTGLKKSAKGLLHVAKDMDDNFVVLDQVSKDMEHRGLLRTVYHNGDLVRTQTFEEIRATLHA